MEGKQYLQRPSKFEGTTVTVCRALMGSGALRCT
jgi:hypothetical protein